MGDTSQLVGMSSRIEYYASPYVHSDPWWLVAMKVLLIIVIWGAVMAYYLTEKYKK